MLVDSKWLLSAAGPPQKPELIDQISQVNDGENVVAIFKLP